LEDWDSIPGRRNNDIFSSLHHRVETGSGVHPSPIQRVPEALTPGAKRPGREAYPSPTSSGMVKNARS